MLRPAYHQPRMVEDDTLWLMPSDKMAAGNQIHYDPATNTIYIKGTFGGNYGLGKLHYDPDRPLVIDGQGNTLLTQFFSVMDCAHVILRNMHIQGGVEVNSSYPEIGLHDITFEKCLMTDSWSRGFFLGCKTAHNLTIDDCVILRTLYGTHGIYETGGHWDSDYGPVEHCVIKNSKIGITPGGRNGIQFNGRFKHVILENNLIFCNELNGITFIGVQGGKIHNNTIFGNGRSAVVIYDYAHSWAHKYNWFETQADIDDFCSTHQPNQNIEVTRNTLLVGPTQFHHDYWHDNNPLENHPPILVNNGVHSGFTFWKPDPETGSGKHIEHPGFPFPTKDIVIADNILWSPRRNMLAAYHPHEASKIRLLGNMAWSSEMGQLYFSHYQNFLEVRKNFVKDPQFVNLPKYPNINGDSGFDWKQFPVEADLTSPVGIAHGVGAEAAWQIT